MTKNISYWYNSCIHTKLKYVNTILDTIFFFHTTFKISIWKAGNYLHEELLLLLCNMKQLRIAGEVHHDNAQHYQMWIIDTELLHLDFLIPNSHFKYMTWISWEGFQILLAIKSHRTVHSFYSLFYWYFFNGWPIKFEWHLNFGRRQL